MSFAGISPAAMARALFLLISALTSLPCFAGTFTAFGPKTYVRNTGMPVTTTDTFSVLNPKTQYTLRLHNGGLNGEFPGNTSTDITVNGVAIISPKDLDPNVPLVEKPLTLKDANQIVVRVQGMPGSGIAVEIVGVDNDPPVIQAKVSPTPNAAGWNNTNVTVTFVCSDATSGIANCPPPQTISSEGTGQVVSGTATDKVGNTASTSVTIKLDKAPPTVTIASPSNGSTISLSTISIGLHGSESDGLSGIAGVTCNGSPASIVGANFTCTVLLTQGPNSISVQAEDVAGNSSTSPLSLTFAPAPQIKLTSPVNLTITNISPVTVNGTVSDPAATVTVNGIQVPQSGGSFATPVPLVEGLNVLAAVATNSSGVVSTATVQVTLDTTPPHITIDSPADGSTTTADSVTVTGLANDIVAGTVNAQDVQVAVNGISAAVANRTYAAVDVPLGLGRSTIQATARDHAGNSITTSISITRVLASQPPPPAIGNAVVNQSLSVVSGNNQTGTIGTQLAQPLVVTLTDPANNPVANQTVVFKVTGNNGNVSNVGGTLSSAVAVTTDLNGHAQALWTLGGRAGAGINTVQASSTLAFGAANFTATGTSAGAFQIVVDSGNDQTGVLGQPLGFPFVADVVDSGHNRVPNVPVTFTVQQGDGTLSGSAAQTVNTDSNGRAIVVLTLGTQIGNDNNLVGANFGGNPGAPASFTASGRSPGNPANTTVSGVVLDNSNNPIPGVTIRLFQTNQGNNNNLPVQVGTPVQTAANGTFLIQPAPVGFFKLMADGATVQGPNSYPTLEYDLVTVAGNDNTVGMPIYLPAIDRVNQLCVDDTHGGTLTLPQVPGFSLTVLPGSATFPGGSRTGCVSVTPVNGDKIPMAPGFGQQPRFIVSIQPAGTRFDPPAPMTLPNVDGLQPRAVTEMYSYDHDLGMFVAIGTGTVSADGSAIASNPGVGVLKAGWHCGGDPNSSGSSASLSVKLDQTKVVKKVGDQFNITASGSPPQDGTYTWEIISTQQGDDSSMATLTASPSCDGQPTCVATVQIAKAGTATLRVHFKCKTTGKEVTADARLTAIEIKQSDDLWWFNGESPAGYKVSVTLTATGATTGSFQWDVTAGTDKVNFENNATIFSATDRNTVGLKSIGASAAAANVTKDVTIRLTYNGTVVGDFNTVVFAPRQLVFLRFRDNADATFGYLSEIHYKIQDQFNQTLPNNVVINERFTTGQTADFNGTNWRQSLQCGATGICPTVASADWFDMIGGENLALPPIPIPQAPQTPLGNVAVAHWDGEWRVGSPNPGRGLRVQTNRWSKFRDHARHTNVTSPAP